MVATHFRTCPLCEAMCGIAIDVDGGRIAGIRGDDDDPFSRGHICPKAPALADLHDDPDRLRQPLRRVGAGFEPVSWDEALDEAGARLHEIQKRRGRSTVATYLGNPTVHNHGTSLFAPLLVKTLRSKSRYSATSADQLPHHLSSFFMLGEQLLLPVPDIDRTRFFLILGGNPLASMGSIMTAPDIKARLAAIRARGGRVVVVDPRSTETARIADEHVFIRPGTDALLLLALLHVILGEHGARLGALAPIVRGLDKVTELVKGFAPEQVAAPTGIGADVIRRLARSLWDTDPAVVYGRTGASQQAFGTVCQWLIQTINVVTGNFDRPGGAMLARPAVDVLAAARSAGIGRGSFGRWKSQVRGLPESGGELPVATLAEDILADGAGRIRGLVTIAGNPVLSTPNGAQLDRALAKLDFMVSVDCYVNETTRHAHLILPPTSPLEHSHYDAALHVVAIRNTSKWSPALFDPPPGSKHDWEILLGLKDRLEVHRGRSLRSRVENAALARLGPDGILDLMLRAGPYGFLRGGLSMARLRRAPHGVDLGPLEPCLPGRLPRDHRFIELGAPELVADVERARPLLGSAPNGKLLLVGRRHLRSNNSWMHNVPKLVAGKPRCTLLVHPDDARRLGLAAAGTAVVTSRVGSVRVQVEVSDEIMPGVVSLPHGFGHGRAGVRLSVAARAENAGVSANDLTDELLVDGLSGNAALNGVPVEVAPA
jgi:anaerobic selenocysteine-containing dehydrogenase